MLMIVCFGACNDIKNHDDFAGHYPIHVYYTYI